MGLGKKGKVRFSGHARPDVRISQRNDSPSSISCFTFHIVAAAQHLGLAANTEISQPLKLKLSTSNSKPSGAFGVFLVQIWCIVPESTLDALPTRHETLTWGERSCGQEWDFVALCATHPDQVRLQPRVF